MSPGNREDLLLLVASLYYEHDHNQQEIADRLRLNRSNVSRLLKEAKNKGLVEIRIHRTVATVPELEREMVTRFGLQHAMVTDNRGNDYSSTLAAAGRLAAQYLEAILHTGDVMGISWGTGVSAAVSAFAGNPSLQVEVVQMIGSVGTIDSVIDGPELARQLAMKLGGRYYYLHAPLFVDSPTVRDALIEQSTIGDTLKRARRASVGLVGIGTTEAGASSFLRAGHLTEEQLAILRSQGVVGETAGQHFDIEGEAAPYDINQRVIGISLDDLKCIPHVVAVACGLKKKLGIFGALHGGLVKAIATDAETAQAVLEVDELHRADRLNTNVRDNGAVKRTPATGD